MVGMAGVLATIDQPDQISWRQPGWQSSQRAVEYPGMTKLYGSAKILDQPQHGQVRHEERPGGYVS